MFMHATTAVSKTCAAGNECVKHVTVAASADKFVFLWRLVAACLTLLGGKQNIVFTKFCATVGIYGINLTGKGDGEVTENKRYVP